MKYYMAKRDMNMIFYPNGMKRLHAHELLTTGELKKYGISHLDNFDEVELSPYLTYKVRYPGESRRLVRFSL